MRNKLEGSIGSFVPIELPVSTVRFSSSLFENLACIGISTNTNLWQTAGPEINYIHQLQKSDHRLQILDDRETI